MKQQTKLNAIRSGLVVMGASAFGYLTMEIGFKPFLLKAQEEERQKQQQESHTPPPEESQTHESY
ncbi:unnamed protein product [Linum tenue]|uniref:Uncharacterized protein n=1 Tax=Linum tenue TaxID=586396 RepID=A0AAV0P6P4_9ROSI|nr:unnamed protein product [Linum tenue]